jgi:hypothetical protein
MWYKKKESLIIIILSIIIVISISLILLIPKSQAVYTSSNSWNYNYKTNSFYISSNKLDTTSINTIINNYNYETINVEINNYLNDLMISGVDIKYNLKCTINSNYNCLIDNISDEINATLNSNYKCFNKDKYLDLDEETCTSNNYSYLEIKNNNIHTLTITSNNKTTDSKINVQLELNTTYPYSKKLIGTITLNLKEETTSYETEIECFTNSNICRLVLTNNLSTSNNLCLNVNNSNFYFDTTISSNNTLTKSKYCFTINSYDTSNITIYRKDIKTNLTVNDIIISTVN